MPDQKNSSRDLKILTGAIENTNEAFITIDQQHQVLIFNRAAETIFGYRREEVVGSDLLRILGPECREGHERAVARYVSERKPRLIGHETEFQAIRRDGSHFPASLSFSVAEIDGELYFTALVRDLTETKKLQEQVAQAERLALLGQAVAEISHEIKNPLLLIGGTAHQLRRKATQESDLAKLQLITEEVSRLEGLLAELRNLYLPRRLRSEEIKVNELLRRIYDLTQPAARAEEITMVFRPAAGEPVILGDRERLTQVFLNIVRNGLEALSSGGRLEIVAETRPRGGIEVNISDTGPGMAPEVKAKMFTPFFTTKKRGTGLGLAISKRIVEEHPDSSLAIFSKEGEGTRVRIILPPPAGDRPLQEN